MKTTFDLRVPQAEPYAYIEMHASECTEQEAYEKYVELIGISRGGVGLLEKEWKGVLDAYLEGQGCTPEVFYRMNTAQQVMISEIKKSMTRRGVRGTNNKK